MSSAAEETNRRMLRARDAMDRGYAQPLGTFSRTFTRIVGCSPREFRRRVAPGSVPTCFTKAWARPYV